MNIFINFFAVKKVLLLSIVFICCVSNLSAQDIFSKDNSKKFAGFLLMSGEYKLAASELERVLFLDPEDEIAKVNLLKSYRYSRQFDKGLKRADELYPVLFQMPENVFVEYSKLLLVTHNFSLVEGLLDQSVNISAENSLVIQSVSKMYQADWPEAEVLVNQISNSNEYYVPLSQLVKEGKQIRYKSPLLSGTLSAIIPGMGKIYSGYWKDGLIALAATGISAWQSYRGFNKDGIKSPYGWIYGFMTVGFYIGNIYGSVKAANKYNHVKNHEIQHHIEDIYIYN